jgi:xanthine dehydrogenase/oxidase
LELIQVSLNHNFFYKSLGNRVAKSRLAFGGLAPTSILAKKTAHQMIGKDFAARLVDPTCKLLHQEIGLSGDPPGGMAEYRTTLALSFFFKFYLSVIMEKHPDSMPLGSITAIEKLYEVGRPT